MATKPYITPPRHRPAPTFTQERVSWDNDGMAKYAASHPDVLQLRKQGNPIVTLRAINKD